MNRQTKLILILLSIVPTVTRAQSSLPLPEVTTFVRQAILQQRFAESKEQNYVFREDTNDIRLKKECTWAPKCPAPFGTRRTGGVAFQVTNYAEHHFEVFWLDGVRVARILPSCDHCGREGDILTIPVSNNELIAENKRVDSEVTEAKALRAEGKNPSSPDDPPQILLSRLLELCTLANARRKVINGRPTIVLDLAWNPSAVPESTDEALIKSFSGTIAIDEEEHAVQHVEGRFLADVTLDRANIRIRKGTRLTITNKRIDTGIWLLSRLDAWGEGHYFAFAIDGAGHIFTGNYRRFRVTSTILPATAEAPTNSSSPH